MPVVKYLFNNLLLMWVCWYGGVLAAGDVSATTAYYSFYEYDAGAFWGSGAVFAVVHPFLVTGWYDRPINRFAGYSLHLGAVFISAFVFFTMVKINRPGLPLRLSFICCAVVFIVAAGCILKRRSLWQMFILPAATLPVTFLFFVVNEELHCYPGLCSM